MNRIIKWIITLIIITFLCQMVAGQTPEELFKLAIRNNPELMALEAEYRANLERIPQTGQLANPELGLGGFISPVETRLGPQRARVSLTQMFPWFGTLDARKELTAAAATTDTERIHQRKRELFFELQSAWLKLYEVRESQRIIRRNLDLLTSLKRLAEIRVEAGKSTLAEVIQADLKIHALEQKLKILDISAQKPLADINRITFRNTNDEVIISDSLSFIAVPQQPDSLVQALRQHPAIGYLSARQEVARQAIQLNRQEGKPSFGLGADYIMVDGRTDLIPENNGRDIFQVRATISIPVFREKYQAKTREENLRIENLEYRKEALLSSFMGMITHTLTEWEELHISHQLYRDQIASLTSAIRIMESDYSINNRKFEDLLALEMELINYELQLLNTTVNSHIAKAKFEELTGLNQ